MGVSLFPRRTVEDAAIDLIRGVQALRDYRAEAERVAADLEARWSANRVALCSEVDTEA